VLDFDCFAAGEISRKRKKASLTLFTSLGITSAWTTSPLTCCCSACTSAKMRSMSYMPGSVCNRSEDRKSLISAGMSLNGVADEDEDEEGEEEEDGEAEEEMETGTALAGDSTKLAKSWPTRALRSSSRPAPVKCVDANCLRRRRLHLLIVYQLYLTMAPPMGWFMTSPSMSGDQRRSLNEGSLLLFIAFGARDDDVGGRPGPRTGGPLALPAAEVATVVMSTTGAAHHLSFLRKNGRKPLSSTNVRHFISR